jgi:hypothetical protein
MNDKYKDDRRVAGFRCTYIPSAGGTTGSTRYSQKGQKSNPSRTQETLPQCRQLASGLCKFPKHPHSTLGLPFCPGCGLFLSSAVAFSSVTWAAFCLAVDEDDDKEVNFDTAAAGFAFGAVLAGAIFLAVARTGLDFGLTGAGVAGFVGAFAGTGAGGLVTTTAFTSSSTGASCFISSPR